VILVDTNVLLDIVQDDPAWADWSVQQLRAQSQVHELAITPTIYAELSLAFESVADLDDTLEGIGLTLEEPPRAALFLAGRAYLKYRRIGGQKANVLADFFVGAHAAILGCAILTRDGRRYRQYFPRVSLITPHAAGTAG
jgi:predicted nucleic acid-binding protein